MKVYLFVVPVDVSLFNLPWDVILYTRLPYKVNLSYIGVHFVSQQCVVLHYGGVRQLPKLVYFCVLGEKLRP